MPYNHTQHAPLHFIVSAPAIICLGSAWFARGDPTAVAICVAVAFTLFLAAAMCHHLTVADEGDWLAVRFGPLPLLSKRIRYDRMTAVAPDRSSILDGWGIHYMPGKGWIYNLWGFDCVRVSLGNKAVRVGTNDLDNLLAFLCGKITEPSDD